MMSDFRLKSGGREPYEHVRAAQHLAFVAVPQATVASRGSVNNVPSLIEAGEGGLPQGNAGIVGRDAVMEIDLEPLFPKEGHGFRQ